jgi:hypothetical protein
MKKHFTLLSLLFITCFIKPVFSQTTLINPTGDGGFELGNTFGANGWTVINNASNTANNWHIGNAAVPTGGGNRGAYISSSSNGSTNDANWSNQSTVHFYKDVTVPAGQTVLHLQYTWRNSCMNNNDRILIFVAPTTFTPAVGSPVASAVMPGANLVSSQNHFNQSTFVNASVYIPNNFINNQTSAQTVRLIITWQNEGVNIGPNPAGAIDRISLVSSEPLPDVGVSAMLAPAANGCYTANETVRLRITNHGPSLNLNNDTSITLKSRVTLPGGGTQNFTDIILNSGPFLSGATIDTTVATGLNMTPAGIYTFVGFTTLLQDTTRSNDTLRVSRTTYATVNLPQIVPFSGWNGTNPSLNTINPGWFKAQGNPFVAVPNNALANVGWTFVNNYTFTNNTSAKVTINNPVGKNEWIISPRFNASANTLLRYKIGLTQVNSLVNPSMMGSDDRCDILVSTNCGQTWAPIKTYNQASNLQPGLMLEALSLGAYAGQNIMIAFYATNGSIADAVTFDLHLDDINIADVTGFDVGVAGLIAPVVKNCYNNCEVVTVSVKNYGISSIDFSLNPAVINWNVNGNTQPAVNVNTGTIPPNGTINITLTTCYQMANMSGNQNFGACIALSNDYDATNNCMSPITRNVAQLISFPMLETFNVSTAMPANWTTNPTTGPTWALSTSMTNPNLPLFSGGTNGKTAFFGSNTFNPGVTASLITPCLNFSFLTSPAIEFYMTQSSTYPLNRDSMYVVMSKDGGLTWPDTLGGFSRYNPQATTPFWKKFEICMAQYAGMTELRIAFVGKSAFGHNIGLEDVRIFNDQGSSVSAGSITASGGTSICAGTSTTLNSNNASGTIQWQSASSNNGPFAPAPTPNHFTNYNTGSLQTTTHYRVFVTGTGIACINKDSTSVLSLTVLPSPVITLGPDTVVCGASSITLNNPCPTQPVPSSFAWTLLPSTSLGSGCTKTVSAPGGTYVATGTGLNGCITRDTITVSFAPAYAGPSITPASAIICRGTSTTLTAGNGTGFIWNTGATTAAITESPSNSTTYTVTGTNASGCKGTASVSVTVNDAAVVNLGTDTTFCGNSLMLDAGSHQNASYKWNDDPSQVNQMFNATYGGYHFVDVTVGNCVTRDSILVDMKAKPFVSLGSDTAICGTYFLDAGNSGSRFKWSTTDTVQLIYIQNPNPATPGVPVNYWVEVTSPDGCKSLDTVTVTFSPAPIYPFGYTTRQYCGTSATLDAQNAGSTVIWNGQTPNPSTGQFLPVTTSGWHYVDIINTYGCHISDTVFAQLNAFPAVNLGNDTTYCSNLIYLNSGNANVTHLWSTGATTQTIPVTLTGKYWVRVTNSAGCVTTDTINLTMNPPAIINAGADRIVCAGTKVKLTATGGTNYQWNPGGSGNPIEHTPFVTTTYSVQGTNANGCIGNDQVTVTVVPLPNSSFSYNVSGGTVVTFENTSNNTGNPGPVSYYWSFGDGQSSTNPGFAPNYVVHNYFLAGNYPAMLIASNSCGNDTMKVPVTLGSVGIQENAADMNLDLFPNPSKGTFTLKFDNDKQQLIDLRITGMNGQLLYQEKSDYSSGRQQKVFNLEQLSSGVYYLQLVSEDSLITRKLIINK